MLDVLYEDQNLRVLNKPENISLLADRKDEANLWEQLRNSGEKPFLVHRLDKGTSGVLLIARNQATQSRLTRYFASRQVHKFYLASVTGKFPSNATLHLDLPLCKGRKSRYRIAGERQTIRRTGNIYNVKQDREGLPAQTLVRCLDCTEDQSLLMLKPITGRTHQLRVHLSWLGHPIRGDRLYGKPDDPTQSADRLMLHCHRLVVPGHGVFTAPCAAF